MIKGDIENADLKAHCFSAKKQASSWKAKEAWNTRNINIHYITWLCMDTWSINSSSHHERTLAEGYNFSFRSNFIAIKPSTGPMLINSTKTPSLKSSFDCLKDNRVARGLDYGHPLKSACFSKPSASFGECES